MNGLVELARNQYASLGFDTLPLLPGSKKPAVRAWQSRSPFRLWNHAPEAANIGIRAGGEAHVAIIDCDESRHPGTFETVRRWLAGLGYEVGTYPVVQSASGVGRHIYVHFPGELAGEWRKLSRAIGAGEFRYGEGAFVAAPPSVVREAGTYRLIAGDFERRPTLTTQDILPILTNRDLVIRSKPRMPRLACAILQGKESARYSSRSEAEQAALLSLANAGYEFTEVLEIFNRYPAAGKYPQLRRENPNNAVRWLQHSFSEAVQFSKAHESKTRETAKAAIAWAASTAWPGRTGPVDQTIFIAHMKIAYKAGRLTWAASRRDLADLAGVTQVTATHASDRLEEDYNLIALETKSVADCANVFRLTIALDKLNHFRTPGDPGEWLSLAMNHDAFRKGRGKVGMTKTAWQVWQTLRSDPATLDELARITGRKEPTIRRTLHKMAHMAHPITGECLPMVASNDGKTWHALDVDLDSVAHAVGTAGKGECQRLQHAKEREEHARSLLLGQIVPEAHLRESGDTGGA